MARRSKLSSAARGILSAIYAKPAEFWWQITRIEVLNPIRYITFKMNEVKSTVSVKGSVENSILYTDEDRTQRQTQALRDVRYRIAAIIRPQPGFQGSAEQLYQQALRRIRAFFDARGFVEVETPVRIPHPQRQVFLSAMPWTEGLQLLF